MNRIVRLRLTKNVACASLSYAQSFSLVGSIVLVSFMLPLRVVWCRIQPLLVIGLVVLGALTRRKRLSQKSPIVKSAQRSSLSSYDILIRDSSRGATRWDEAIFVYAAWIAYGSLFHEAKHAAADLDIIDDTWISSALMFSVLRAVLFTAGTCFSYSHAFVQRAPSFWFSFFLYAVLLLALPPLNGVPHTLIVYDSIARGFAFLWFFGVNEFMRNVVEHWNFANLVSEDSLDASTVLKLGDIAKMAEKPYADELPELTVKAGSHTPRIGVYNDDTVPVSWSVLRSSWILTLSSTWMSYVCAIICFLSISYNTDKWSRSAASLLRQRSQGGEQMPKNPQYEDAHEKQELSSIVVEKEASKARQTASAILAAKVKSIPTAMSARTNTRHRPMTPPAVSYSDVLQAKTKSSVNVINNGSVTSQPISLQQKKLNFTRRLAENNTCASLKKEFDRRHKMEQV